MRVQDVFYVVPDPKICHLVLEGVFRDFRGVYEVSLEPAGVLCRTLG